MKYAILRIMVTLCIASIGYMSWKWYPATMPVFIVVTSAFAANFLCEEPR